MSDDEKILESIVDTSSSDEEMYEEKIDIKEFNGNNEDIDDLTTSIQKPKKERTEKQKLAFEKARGDR